MGRALRTERGRVDRGRTVLGLTLIAIGVLLTLQQLGVLRFGGMHELWPLFLIVPGIAKLFTGRRRFAGVSLITVGLIFLADAFDLAKVRQTWPLFFVPFGITLVWRGVRRERAPAAPEQE